MSPINIDLILRHFVISGALSNFLTIVWLTLLIGAILVGFVPGLRKIGHHGKLNISPEDSDPIDRLFSVPKKRFIDFYSVGIAITVLFMMFLYVSASVFSLALVLFLLHVSRRLYESVAITSYGNSKMHLGGYLVGLLHYILVPLTLYVDIAEKSGFHPSSTNSLKMILLAVIFISANVLQYQCHRILFELKSSVDQRGMHYRLPEGSLFNYCVCPHYFCEILLYGILLLMHISPATLSMFAWVAGNLSVVGYNQYSWYIDNCFEDMKRRPNLAIIFPFVW